MERVLVVIETATDLVENVVLASGEYDPGSGRHTVEAPGAIIGWLWNGGDQQPPPVGE